MSVYSLYFSPTGGTRKVMDILAEGISVDSWIDLSEAETDYGKYSFTKDDLCLIGVPSFGGRVPTPVLERMKQMKANGAAAILVVVYGNRAYDDTFLELKNEAKACGFRVGAAISAVAEHSIMRRFAAGRPDARDEAELRAFAKDIAELIAGGKLAKDISVPGNEPYREYDGVPFKPKGNRSCTKCGLCAVKCPVGAIPKETPAKLDAKKCISCMRCVAICPENARRFNKIALFAAGKAVQKYFAGRKPNELFV